MSFELEHRILVANTEEVDDAETLKSKESIRIAASDELVRKISLLESQLSKVQENPSTIEKTIETIVEKEVEPKPKKKTVKIVKSEESDRSYKKESEEDNNIVENMQVLKDMLSKQVGTLSNNFNTLLSRVENLEVL